jgi:large subunit ribosomal protein L25
MKIQHTLSVERRDKTGSRYARRERDRGRLPAVLYGHGKDPVALSLDAKEAIRFFELGEKVFNISLATEGKEQAVLLKDLQFDYLGTNIVHVDLARVDLTEEIEAQVHLHFVGEAKGAKALGAVFQTLYDYIPVKCTVAALPDEIIVNVTNVTADEPLHVSDLNIPEGVEVQLEPDDIVATISLAAAMPEPAESETIEGEAAGPEVISDRKPEDEGDG